MKRTKCLGAVVVVALALAGLLGTASASASWIVSESSMKATPTGSHNLYVPSQVPCTASSFTSKGPIATETLESESIPDYSCNFWGEQSMKWNGCKLFFHPGAEISAGVFGGTVDIGPAGCGPIKMTYLGSCETQILPSTGLAAEFTNTGTGSSSAVTLTINATSKVNYKGTCSGNGAGSYFGSWNLTAGKGVHVSQVGVYIDGQESTEESKQPKFNAGAYPAGIAGAATSPLVVTLPLSRKVECKTGALSSLLAKATSSLNIKGSYGPCSASGFGFSNASVTLNSCFFNQQLNNVNPIYTGSAAIGCDKEGDAIQVSATFLGSPICTAAFPPQKIGSSAYYNAGGGSFRHFGGEFAGVGLHYTVTNPGGGEYCGPASGESAGLSAAFEMRPGYTLP